MSSHSDKSNQRKTALVTGASAGIGYELAKVLAENGFDLVLIARNKERLEAVADELEASFNVRAAVMCKDLVVPRAPDEIFEELERAGVTIDVLVNNAGYGTHGPFHESDTQKELDMIQLNVTALVHLTRLVVPGMVARGSGRIMNVASTAAFQPGPFMAIYYATKAFGVSFSEAIGNELKGTGVTVTAFCPGPTRTEFQQRAGIEASRLNTAGMIADADEVARFGYRAMMKGRPLAIPGVKNRTLAFAVRFFPRQVVLKVVRRLNQHR